MSLEMVSG